MASWMSADDNAAAGAIRSLLLNTPPAAREAVLADVAAAADPEAQIEIRDIMVVEEIDGMLPEPSWRRDGEPAG